MGLIIDFHSFPMTHIWYRATIHLWVSHPTPVFFSSSIDFVHKNLIFFYLGFEYFLLDLLEHRGGDFVKSGFSEEKILVGFGWIEGKTRTLQIAKRGSLGGRKCGSCKRCCWFDRERKRETFFSASGDSTFSSGIGEGLEEA